jgi:multidrug resistance efflux pump
MRTYRSRDFKTDDLDDTHALMQHAQDELAAAQSYVHHLEIELHERDEQLEASQAQATDLLHELEHLQKFIPWSPRRTIRRLRACPVWTATRLSILRDY